MSKYTVIIKETKTYIVREQQCKLKKKDMKKARCDLWWGLHTFNQVTLNNLRLFWSDDGICMYMQAKEE